MKNKRPLFVVLLCLLLAGGVVLALLPRCPMPWQCSKTYWEYAKQNDIKQEYVCNYPVDDTTLVDVTLLHATTDSAWVSLCQEFILPEYPDAFRENVIHGNSVTHWGVSDDDPHIHVNPSDIVDCDLLVISPHMMTICIFHSENRTQRDAIIAKIIKDLNKNNLNKKQL
jgi:hypothetical protein